MQDIQSTHENYQGDAIEILHRFKKEGRTFPMSIFSTPFSSLYVYSSSKGDLSNVRSHNEFLLKTSFFAKALEPVIDDGRMVCVHITQLAETLGREGRIALKDLCGDYIRVFEDAGFDYWGEVAIAKDPRPIASVKKTQQLMFGTLKKDALKCRPALHDKALFFRKRGANKVPVKPVQNGEISFEEWCMFAYGVWSEIDETNVVGAKGNSGVSARKGRGANDEKHLTPTQIPFYERMIKWFSNKGEEVLDPFAGSGTNSAVCIKMGRKPINIELKENYYNNLLLPNTVQALEDRKKTLSQLQFNF